MKIFGLNISRNLGAEPPPKVGVEAARQGSAIDLGWMENPHQLIQRKGLAVVDEMLKDDTVSAVYQMKVEAILSPGWMFEASLDKMEWASEWAAEMLDGVDGHWREALRELCSAYMYGFAWAHKKLKYVEEGTYAGTIALEALKVKKPHNMKFKLDEYNNIEKLLGFSDSGGEPEPLDPSDFVVFSHNGNFGNPYGTPDCLPCYRWVVAKKYFLRFQTIALERLGGGVRRIKFPRDIHKEEKEFYHDMVKNMGADMGFAGPDDVDMDILEAKGAGWIAYERAIDMCNRAISGVLLMPNRMGIGGTDFASGSFALAKTQLNIYLMHLRNSADHLSDIIQQQVIVPIWNMNFEGEPPRFKIKDFSTTDKVAIAKAWIEGASKGAAHLQGLEDENFFRDLLGAPILQELAIEEEEPEEEEPEEEEPEEEEEEKENARRYVRRPEYERRVDFSAIEDGLNRIENQIGVDVDAVMSDILHGVLKKVPKIIEEQDVERIDSLQLQKIGTLKELLTGGFFASYVLGKAEAKKTVDMAWKEAEKEEIELKYAAPEKLPVSLTTEEAKKILKALAIPVTRAELKRIKHLAFNIAGITRNKVLEEVKTALITGLNKGQPWTETRIRNIFKKYKVSLVTKSGKDVTAFRTETIIRTETSRAFQWGQQAMYDDPFVKQYIVAWEWASIIDDSTSEYCADMDGRIMEPGTITPPPAHPRCRSDLVPVFEWDRREITGPSKISRKEGF